MNEIKKQRAAGIDIIKTLAVVFVVCVHFFLKTYYYKTPVDSGIMLLQSYIRWIFVTSVPLFLLCTGYLEWKKEASTEYYRKIFRVVIPYALISIICIFVNIAFFDKSVSFREGIYSIFNFSADTYSWYVNMYIGLFFLIPVFNAAIKALDRKKLEYVIISLVFIIAAPSYFNPIFKLFPDFRLVFFPDWWKEIYPVMYYFVGAYISKYRPTVKKPVCIAAVALIPAVQTLLQMYLNSVKFDNWRFTDYSNILTFILSTFIFLLFYNADIKHNAPKKIFRNISALTLEIYLLSNLTDKGIYGYFKEHVFPQDEKLSQNEVFLKYFFIIVPLTFLSAFLSALVFDVLYKKGKMISVKIAEKTGISAKIKSIRLRKEKNEADEKCEISAGS